MQRTVLTFTEHMPMPAHTLIAMSGDVWRDSDKMPISHTSVNICCVHDEDNKREVRLEMRSEALKQRPTN